MPHQLEIVLVEDRPEDAELTIRALRRSNIVNDIQVVEDGPKLWTSSFAVDLTRIAHLLILRDSSFWI
jgi:hypothetical protein